MIEESVLIIVPAFNESGNIARTVKELLSLRMPLTVLVVDDGSQDATALEARQAGARVVSLPFNIGIGGAVQTGFQYAIDKGFSLAVQVDGDDQHDVSFLERLIEPIKTQQADMVIGSRFLPPFIGYRSSLVRRLGIHFFASLISLLTGTKVTDPTSGFRAFNRRVMRIFVCEYPHDFPEPEAIMVARRYSARIKEVPVKMRKRQTGHSSIRYLATLYYMIKVTSAILFNMIKVKQR